MILYGSFILLLPILAAINAFVGPYAVLPYVAVTAVICALVLPLDLLLFGCLLVAALLAGLIEYFGGISQVFWLPYLVGGLLAVRGLVQHLQAGPSVRSSAVGKGKNSALPNPITLLAFIYIAIAFFGTIVALPPLLQVIIGTKNYFFLWGILLALLWCPWSISSSKKFWTLVTVVACLQLPFVLYQRLFVAARRTDAAKWDAVVGTFGGDPTLGGNSAAMAFVCCLAVALLIFRMRDNRLHPLWAASLALFCLVPIALAEVKAAFIWLLVVFVVLYAPRIVRDPVRAVLGLLAGCALLVGLGLVYEKTYQDSGGGATLEQIYDKQIKYALDPNEYSSTYHRLGRVTALVFWWERHDLLGNPAQMLVGHGLGASRSSSSVGAGELARRLPVEVDTSAASALLWDLGLLGALAFAAFLVTAAFSGIRLAQRSELPIDWRESCALAGTTLTLASFGLFYNRDAIDNPTVQILIYFSIAQVFLAKRQILVDPQLTEPASKASPAKFQRASWSATR